MCYAGCKYENMGGECTWDFKTDVPDDAICKKAFPRCEHLQLSGKENVCLLDNGALQIFGLKIAETELEVKEEIVGIQYPPEFALQLLDFLKKHEDDIMLAAGCDPLDDCNQMREDMDGDHQSALASIGWGNDEDYFHESIDSD